MNVSRALPWGGVILHLLLAALAVTGLVALQRLWPLTPGVLSHAQPLKADLRWTRWALDFAVVFGLFGAGVRGFSLWRGARGASRQASPQPASSGQVTPHMRPTAGVDPAALDEPPLGPDWRGQERRSPTRARNVVRPAFGAAPPAASGTHSASPSEWEPF